MLDIENQQFYAQIIEKFPDTDKEALSELIENINQSDINNHYNMIIALIDKMLMYLAENGIEHGLNQLNTEERFKLESKINNLLVKFKKEGKNINSKQIIQFLLGSIHKKFQQKYKIGENSYKTSEETKLEKDYKEHITKMITYEFYKFVNPRQIAGETALENFINNVVFRGLNYAMKYEGKENFSEDKHFTDTLESKHKDFYRDINKNNSSGLGM